jgi:DNA-binding XRE family transcriptional regulator
MNTQTRLPIESLSDALAMRFQDGEITLDKPRKQTGIWHLDVTVDNHCVHVQWQIGRPFGIAASPDLVYGEGADEVYEDDEAAYGRIVSLLLSRTFTSPPRAVNLRELRKECGLSQVELAEILHKQQGEISKIERRKDLLVSTLADYVRAIQGELQIIVRMADGSIRRVRREDAQ